MTRFGKSFVKAASVGSALALVALSTALITPSAAAAPTSVTLVGSLQSELGCAADWAATCATTHLIATDIPGVFSATFTIPANPVGEVWEYKVAINDSFDESYGANGGNDNMQLVIAGDTEMIFSYDDSTHRTSLTPTTVTGGYTAADDALIQGPVRQAGAQNQYYFVMTDRFDNADPTNDEGGLAGDRIATGFDPTDKGFYQGGDLAGLTSQLEYIQGLGTTAIWLTPSFKNKPVQGAGADASSGYHGYWITDFTQIDPHLGTNEDLTELIDKAHAKGMKVFFDIITNHTADVIDYSQGVYSYIDKATSPYKDAGGVPFDPADVANEPGFPAMNLDSFPYTPVIDPSEVSVKVPDWLNDPTLYHNRGDSTFSGESNTYGDFVGLDDLMTENPVVEQGFEEIYQAWVDFGVDGFRVDTVKHVNTEFWQDWTPAIMNHAASVGNDDFYMFGEVYDASPTYLSTFLRNGSMPSVLDFGFQDRAIRFAKGETAGTLATLFAGDAMYTTPTTSATGLPTFLGNHDMGRVGFFLKDTTQAEQRDMLAHELMFLSRGNPVIYYGDEQGFTGAAGGNDRDARQSMFPSQVTDVVSQNLIDGTAFGPGPHFGTDGEIYTGISELSKVRADSPALSNGAQIELFADNEAGIYAFSRVDPDQRFETLVAVNNSQVADSATFNTLTPGAVYSPIYGDTGPLTADANGSISVTVGPLSAIALQADRAVAATAPSDGITITVPAAGGGLSRAAQISADIADDRWQETSFSYRVYGGTDWVPLGTAESDSPSVYHDAAVSGLAPGTLIEYRAVSVDTAGKTVAASTYASVGWPINGSDASPVDPELPPITMVTVPGEHNSEMGCAADWVPDCALAQLTLQEDGTWSGTFDLPAGDYAYKVAINGNWDFNYGADGELNGGNITYTNPTDGPVTFVWDPVTKIATATPGDGGETPTSSTSETSPTSPTSSTSETTSTSTSATSTGPTPGLTISSTTLRPGDTFTFTGTGFQPGESVQVWLNPDSILLTTVTAGDDGTAGGSAVIPRDTAIGDHTISALGLTSGLESTQTITVLAAASTPTATTTSSTYTGPPSHSGGKTDGKNLSYTGFPTGQTAGLGLLLVGVGVALIWTSRRGRGAHAPH